MPMPGRTGLEWQTIQFSFGAGLNLKSHPHALEAPQLLRALNVEFDEVGGLRLRKPYYGLGTAIFGGGTLANVRKLAVVDDELLAFTPDTLYSWSDALSKWVSKGTHLAVATAETTRFGNTSDQVFADRAQLGGIVVTTWTEVTTTTVLAHLAIADATTGATILAPTSFGTNGTKPRVVATDTAIFVFWLDLVGLVFYVIDPTAPAFVPGSCTTASANILANHYDVERDPSADRVVFALTDSNGISYTLGRCTPALAVTTTTKVRTADGGAIAVACSRDDNVVVLRATGTTTITIVGDGMTTSTLADNWTGSPIGIAAGALDQLTGAFRSVKDGLYYRCYAYWSSGQASTSSAFELEGNWVDTNNATGTEAVLVLRQGLSARAFNYDGHIYVWSVFAGESSAAGMGTPLGIRAQYQNTHYLHRDDGLLVAKAVWGRAGGFGYYDGHLPGVALVSGTTGFAWCAVEREILTAGGTDHRIYGARAPRDVVFTFDSNSARRVVQLGRTAYVSGGLLLQYDGESLTETGFEQYPWYFYGTPTGAGATFADGAYSYKASWRWQNARGETERSTTATGLQVTMSGNDSVLFAIVYGHITRKQAAWARRPASLEVWRTVKNPPVDAPFYLVTSRDPSATGNNGYLANSPTTGTLAAESDVLTDAVLITHEQHPENGNVLPRMAPPAATILAASDTRLFLAGVPGEPHRIWYSLQRQEHEIVAFNSALSFALPTVTGAITALAVVDGLLIAWTATATYMIDRDGFDNAGGGGNYGPPQLISSDVGAISQDSVAITPAGALFFSAKGWYRLNGRMLEYIGAAVEDYNADSGGFVAAQVLEAQHQVRVLSGSRLLVWDYLVNQWAEWTQPGGLDLAIWRGTPMLLDTAVKKEQTAFSTATYDLDLEMIVKLAGLMGNARCRQIQVLGEYKAAHTQRLRIGRDFQTTYDDDRSKAFSGQAAGSPTQLSHGPSRQLVEAYRVRVTVTAPSADPVTITGLALEVGLKPGIYKWLIASSKQ